METREELRRFQELEALQLMKAVDSSYDMIISVNLTQNTYYMISYERFLNKSAREMGDFDSLIEVGASTVPPSHRQQFMDCFSRESLLQAHARGEKYVYLEHLQVGDDDGLEHWVSTHVMFVDNPFNDDVMEITVSRTIEEQRKKEAEHQKLLAEALLAAEKANSAKSDFLSRMSHDIRTPMNAIIGMTTLAKAQIADTNKVQDCLDKISMSCGFLLGLVNDVLDLSKIESGKMTISNERFRIRDLIDEIAVVIRIMAEDKKQHFVVNITDDIADYYKGDAVRIHQVLMNLLNNAYKYTPKGGTFALNVKKLHTLDKCDELLFEVKDNGIGISEEFLKELFLPFAQEAQTTANNGFGLGLAIAQNLIYLMNGELNVESELGEGSCFRVQLPLERVGGVFEEKFDTEPARISLEVPSSLGIQSSVAFDKNFNGEHILLAEDNDINQEVAKDILELHNLKVDVASTGQEAVDIFLDSTPGYYLAILMDIQMPELNGYQATQMIRNSKHTQAETIPIYAMTANAFSNDVLEAKQKGMNGHIAKPVDFNVVADILNEIIIKQNNAKTEE